MLFGFLDRYRDEGLLVLRAGIGLMMIYHGVPKIMGGEVIWLKLGGAMKFVGITFAPAFWGFMAAFAEFGGGLLLTFGLLTRVAAAMLAFNMMVAVVMKFSTGAGLAGGSNALELAIIFFSLILLGPGKYSLDEKIAKGGRPMRIR